VDGSITLQRDCVPCIEERTKERRRRKPPTIYIIYERMIRALRIPHSAVGNGRGTGRGNEQWELWVWYGVRSTEYCTQTSGDKETGREAEGVRHMGCSVQAKLTQSCTEYCNPDSRSRLIKAQAIVLYKFSSLKTL
jgi:hypothetical protein